MYRYIVMNLALIYMSLRKKGQIAPKYNDYTRESLHALVAFLERGELNLLLKIFMELTFNWFYYTGE